MICTRPDGFAFVAGQHVTIRHREGEREYSILSSPTADTLHFLIKKTDQSRLSHALAELDQKEDLFVGNPKGYLVYRQTDRPVYFVATGVGVAPFVSMAASGVRGFTLIHGAREVSGLFYRKELLLAANRYIPCLSGAVKPGVNLLDLYRGYVTDYIDRHLKPGAYDFYLSGSTAMIHDMTHLLDRHYPGTRIYSEAYA